MSPKIEALKNALLRLLRSRAGDLAITPAELSSLQPGGTPVPATLPMLPLLPAMQTQAGPGTQEMVDALCAAAPDLGWRQTYDQSDGFDQAYLDTYGWCDLVADQGFMTAEGLRVFAGYWGQGLVYPNHSHPPDEHYMVLAGSMWVRLNDDPYVRLGPGGVFHVPSHAVHSAEMRDGPLLAISIWRGADVSVRINLTESDRNIAKA